MLASSVSSAAKTTVSTAVSTAGLNTPSHIQQQPTPTNVVGTMEALETKFTAGQKLSPVEQGELARFKDLAARSPQAEQGMGDVLEKIVEAARDFTGKAVDTVKEAAKAAKAALPKTVEGAKTIDDFNLVGASKQDKADFEAMLVYLQRADADGNAISPTAVELLAQLPEGQTVNINHDHDDHYNPNTGEIAWDPRSALIVDGTDNMQSPALGFIHEVDHAVNRQANPKPTGDDYHNTEEERVITGSEAQIAKDLGEPIRTDHLGTVEHVDNATDHTETNHSPPPRDGSGGPLAPKPI